MNAFFASAEGNILNFVVFPKGADRFAKDGADCVFSVVIGGGLDFTNEVCFAGFEKIELVIAVLVGFLSSDEGCLSIFADNVQLERYVLDSLFTVVLDAVVIVVFIASTT